MGLNENNSEKPRFCGNCGKELIAGATFCAYCGQPVIDPNKPTSIEEIKTESRSYNAMTTVQPYGGQYHRNILQNEPPLPFMQHLRGVITTPKSEMHEIAERPNLRQPFAIVLIVGLISSVGVMILFSKITFNFTDSYFSSLGIPPNTIDKSEVESMMRLIPMMTAIVTPIGFIINWLIDGVILWIIHAVLASRLDPKTRSYKRMLTIIGWSFLPNLIDGTINILSNMLFIAPQTVTVNSNADFENLALTIASNSMVSMLLMIISLVIFAYSIILIYFAIKPIERQGANPIIITLIYTVISFFLMGGIT
ncbi:MAG: YIP1 family protein [Candidatus Hodarchaeales archaeon]